MVRKLAVSLVAVVVAGALAWAGDAVGVTVEGGVDVGSQKVKLFEISGEAVLDYTTVVYQPWVQVSKFGEGLSGSGRIRGLFTTDKDTTDNDDADLTASFNGWDIGGLVGWGFKLNDQWTVAPVAGLSYRSFGVDMDYDNGDSVSADITMLTLDLGVRAEGKLNDKLTLVGLLTFSPVLVGEEKVTQPGDDMTDDIKSGSSYVLEVRAVADYRLNDRWSLFGGVVYELLSEKVEWSDIDENGKDTFSKIALQLGATFKF